VTWDDARDWLWHVANDPIRDNVWSLSGLILIVAGGMGMLYLLGDKVRTMRFRRRTKGDDVQPDDDRAQAAAAIDNARALHDDDADGRTDPAERLQVIRPVAGMAATGQDGPAESVYYPPADPVTDSGVHAAPIVRSLVMQVTCGECGGVGYVEVTISSLLRESIALVPDGGGDMVVKEFYTRLLHAAPGLAEIFPADLLTTDEEKHQRDRLYAALAALANLYDPDDAEKMARLRTAAGSYGRSHASFWRPSEGVSRGATLAEYAAVEATLLETFHAVAGSEWKPEYDEAWVVAFDHLTGMMLDAQHSTPMTAPRFPRAPRS
jgi:hemoglobin-like flavoprotein